MWSCDAVEVGKDYVVATAAALEVKPFKPRSGVVIHTTDAEAQEAETTAGSEYTE